jgi:glycine/D-amino acid oxidase-like deaminating enzyme
MAGAGGGVPFWLDESYEPRPPLEDSAEVEACVVGAGVAGLSCARSLALAGVDTLVLERGVVAGGASGRNGGFLIAGVAAFHPDVRERHGRARARELYARTLEAQEGMLELATSLGVPEAMRRVGLLRVSASEEEADHVRRHVDALREDGFPGVLVERAQLPRALRGFALNGCLTEHDAALQPARWVRALARGAEAAGARICEGTPVASPVTAPGEGPLATPGGSVTARHVVVAADGALPALVPAYAGLVRARRLHMVATEPLPERLTERLVYARWGLEYLQQEPGGRLLAGGFGDLDGESSYTSDDAGSPELWERIERHLREDLGIDAPASHRWAGVVGYTGDGLPYAGAVPGRRGLHVAGGYSGHGNVPGYLAGAEIAAAIAGGPAATPLFSAASRPG